MLPTDPTPRKLHPLPIRIMHWLGALAIICMILSGWAIYNAAPSLPVSIPGWMTLGGWLAAGIAWHIAAMWLLFIDGLAYLVYGFATGHFRRDIAPPAPPAILHDLTAALTFRLDHSTGAYNAVQRLLYAGVLVTICLSVATGLSIWKPVQFGALIALFGGYPVARGIHLAAMIAIVLFIIIHIALVAIYPRTLVSMITGNLPHDAKGAK